MYGRWPGLIFRVVEEWQNLHWMRQWWKIGRGTPCIHAGLFSGGLLFLWGKVFFFWFLNCMPVSPLAVEFYLFLFLFSPRWLSSFISEVYMWLCAYLNYSILSRSSVYFELHWESNGFWSIYVDFVILVDKIRSSSTLMLVNVSWE